MNCPHCRKPMPPESGRCANVFCESTAMPKETNCPHTPGLDWSICPVCIADVERRGAAPGQQTNCPHDRYRYDPATCRLHCQACGVDVTDGPRETALSVCPTCNGNPCDCPERLAAADFTKRMRHLVAELGRCQHDGNRVGWSSSSLEWCAECGARRSAPPLSLHTGGWILPSLVRRAKALDLEAPSLGADLSDGGADSGEKIDN